MDNELNAVSDLPKNISSLSIAELKTALSVRGLSAKGSKKALISRLVKHLEQSHNKGLNIHPLISAI